MLFKRFICMLLLLATLALCMAGALGAEKDAAAGTENEAASLPLTPPLSDTPGTVRELLDGLTLAQQGAAAAAAAAAEIYDGVLIIGSGEAELLRAPEDGAVLRTIPTQRAAHLLETREGWYKVVYRNTTGFVRADRCELVHYEEYAAQMDELLLQQEDIVSYARQWLGVRYRYGGSSMSGTDCSGFTMAVFAKFGYSLPHGAGDQYRKFPSVTDHERDVGDLVFFSTGGVAIGHVGIYLGGGLFIHASTSSGVRIDSLYDSYYGPRYRGAVRVLGL